jgi:chemotaxis methyl-accepting protein methylase
MGGAIPHRRVGLPSARGGREADAQVESGSPGLAEVLNLVRLASGLDVTSYCRSILSRRVDERMAAVGAEGHDRYLHLLETSPEELGRLVDSLTIKVSRFFRDPLAFEYLGEAVLPALLAAKAEGGDPGLRIWSAGCANGEEPYSVAILLRDLARRARKPLEATIFATDVDENALARGREALYPSESLENVRLGLLKSSFTSEGELYRVLPEIAEAVRFSLHDLAEPGSASPAESVFGSFDLVLCRNVLIYFEADLQQRVLERLCRSLAPGGHLLLGPAESLSGPWAGRLRHVVGCPSLYRKPAGSKRSFEGDPP